ncbi:MAG: hypothetical protein WCA46_04795 [Actinocatenispora sp.]
MTALSARLPAPAPAPAPARRLVALAVAGSLVLAVAGCDPGGAPRAARGPGALGAALIRQFDFRNARYHHAYLNDGLREHTAPGDPTVRLAGGAGTGRTATGAPVRCTQRGHPVFGDLGDGHLSAAVALRCEAGTGTSTAWSIWRWDGERHTAEQSDEPIAEDARCGDAVDGVRYSRHSFVVDVHQVRADSDASCDRAQAHRSPARYGVSLRHGYLMRVSPRAGSLRECVRNSGATRSRHGMTVWTTRDARSPVVHRASDGASVVPVGGTDYYEDSGDLGGHPGRRWEFVRVTEPGGAHYCGYRQVGPG